MFDIDYMESAESASEGDRKVNFNDASSMRSGLSNKESVASEDLFMQGKDDIVFEGELMKFKPGLSANFVGRYVQIS